VESRTEGQIVRILQTSKVGFGLHVPQLRTDGGQGKTCIQISSQGEGLLAPLAIHSITITDDFIDSPCLRNTWSRSFGAG
jgi:hypothetical protein